MSRAVRLFVALTILLAQASIAEAVQTTNTDTSNCGRDALLVRPVAKTPPQPRSEVVAYDLDASELDRFPVQDPMVAYHSSVPQRALVQDASNELTFLDLGTGTMTPVPTPIENEAWQIPSYNVELTGNSHYVSAIVGGSAVSNVDYLIDFESMTAIPILEHFGFENSILSNNFVVSPDGEWVVWSGPGMMLGEIANPTNVTQLGASYLVTTPVFAPSSPNLAFWSQDDATSALVVLNYQLGTVTVVETLPRSSVISYPVFLDGETIVYSVDSAVITNDLATQVREVFETGFSDLRIGGIWNHGNTIVLSSLQSSEGPEGWHLLDRGTGNLLPVQAVDGYPLIDSLEESSWIPFGTGAAIAIVDANTGETRSVPDPPGAASDTFDEIYLVGDRTLIVSQDLEAGGSSVTATDLVSGESLELVRTEYETTISPSPDGCFVAVGTYHLTPDVREARVDVFDFAGNTVASFEESNLLGWAPGRGSLRERSEQT